MGALEKESKKRTQKENVQKVVLSVVKGAGLLSVALIAPSVIGAFGKLGILRKDGYWVKRSVTRLVERGLVRFEKTQNGTFARLTPEGERHLYYMYDEGELPKPKKWDGKWRIVIYDLKEERKLLREKLRRTLESFGFLKLQDSVWVYPYDCEDLITLMKADFKIGKDVLYIIADKIENDQALKRKFIISD
ncbi:MAG: CRISPR-associated endonuclease Cas2 [Candidatus Paceibacterota bacterium]|jgi:CRISPR-associated endonuclease Cas2